MTSFRRFSTPSWRWLIIMVVIFVLLIPPLRHLSERTVATFARPIYSFGLAISQRYNPGVSSRQLISERDVLREQVAALTTRLAEAQQKLELGLSIEELNKYVGQISTPTIIASVVAYSPDPGIESIVIARGGDDGVRPGMAVVTADGVMIGKIKTITGRTATVLLLNDSHSQVAARIQNSSGSPGIVNGERGLAMAMNFIPKNDEVKSGQTVVTAGTEPLIRPDIVIGTIREPLNIPGDLFLRATIISPVELNLVRVVAVMLVKP